MNNINEVIQNADVYLIVFNIAEPKTFENAVKKVESSIDLTFYKWYEMLLNHSANSEIFFIGNKLGKWIYK